MTFGIQNRDVIYGNGRYNDMCYERQMYLSLLLDE
jgi:hypothetical protein